MKFGTTRYKDNVNASSFSKTKKSLRSPLQINCPLKIELRKGIISSASISELPASVPRWAGKLTNIAKIHLIQQTINEQIRPALRAHGGNIELIDVEGNKIVVAFRGMCAQCRLADFTMKDVVEAKLKEFVSEQLFVEEDKESASQPHNHRE